MYRSSHCGSGARNRPVEHERDDVERRFHLLVYFGEWPRQRRARTPPALPIAWPRAPPPVTPCSLRGPPAAPRAHRSRQPRTRGRRAGHHAGPRSNASRARAAAAHVAPSSSPWSEKCTKSRTTVCPSPWTAVSATVKTAGRGGARRRRRHRPSRDVQGSAPAPQRACPSVPRPFLPSRLRAPQPARAFRAGRRARGSARARAGRHRERCRASEELRAQRPVGSRTFSPLVAAVVGVLSRISIPIAAAVLGADRNPGQHGTR